MKYYILIFLIFIQSINAVEIVRDAEIEDFLKSLSLRLMSTACNIEKEVIVKDNLNNIEQPFPIYTQTNIIQTKPIPIYSLPTYSPMKQGGFNSAALISQKKNQCSFNPTLYFVNNNDINAFVYGGANIYVHKGLILAYENSDMLAGVLAHELGHIYHSHLIKSNIAQQQSSEQGIIGMSIITLLSIASGGTALGSTIAGFGAGSSIATGNILSFSRAHEKEADAQGMKYLELSGYSGQGLVDLMKYFHNQTGKVPELYKYFQTHPLPVDRIEFLNRFTLMQDKFLVQRDINLEYKFQRVKAKLAGYFGKNDKIIDSKNNIADNRLNKYNKFFDVYKEIYSNFSKAQYDKVISLTESLLTQKMNDIYLNEVIGQSYCFLGKIAEAKKHFLLCRKLSKNNILIEMEFAECLAKNGDSEDALESVKILDAIRKINRNDLHSRNLLSMIAKKYNYPDLDMLMQAEIEIINSNISSAKAILKNAEKYLQDKDGKYKEELLELLKSLS